jgi:Fic family protein
VDLQAKFAWQLQEDGAPPRLFAVVDTLFARPVLNIADLMEQTGTTPVTAGKDIDRLERLGILREYTGRQRERDWLAQDIIDIISSDMSADT